MDARKETISPRQLKILKMDTLHLNQYLNEAMLENPVIELEENLTGYTDEDMRARKAEWLESNDFEEGLGYFDKEMEMPALEQPDYALLNVGSDETLEQHLTKQIGVLQLPERVRSAAIYLAGCLDENGYLLAQAQDLAKEGYAYLLPMQKKHAADPGDGKAMVRARRAFLSAGHYAPLMATLAALCAALPHDHIVDAGCGEGSYDKYLYDALGCPQIAAFDLSKEAVRLASKLVPDAAFCVGGSFCAPVRDGWADLLLNIFSPMAEAEFARMLRPGGHLVYAVPTARHLFGLKEILYDCPYENEVRQTEYDGFAFVKAVESTAVITLEGQSVQDLFAMTPYYWKTPKEGAERLAKLEVLQTEIEFRFVIYRKQG